MRRIALMAAASAATLLAGAAFAQGAQPAGYPDDHSAPLGSPEHPIPKDSPTPPEEAYHLKAGDPNVISNAPIPDTPQNRDAYGQPMSRTGKSTKPSGD